jgi:hypothetical protein
MASVVVSIRSEDLMIAGLSFVLLGEDGMACVSFMNDDVVCVVGKGKYRTAFWKRMLYVSAVLHLELQYTDVTGGQCCCAE